MGVFCGRGLGDESFDVELGSRTLSMALGVVLTAHGSGLIAGETLALPGID